MLLATNGLPQLELLFLSGNKLGDEGAEFIATALKESTTSKLQTLYMYRIGIGSKALTRARPLFPAGRRPVSEPSGTRRNRIA